MFMNSDSTARNRDVVRAGWLWSDPSIVHLIGRRMYVS